MILKIPAVLSVDESIENNPVWQIAEPAIQSDGRLATFTRGRLEGFIFQPNLGEEVLIISKNKPPDGHPRVIRGTINPQAAIVDLSDGMWLRHPLLDRQERLAEREEAIDQVLRSWDGAFSYIQEDTSRNIPGLRAPQIGAVHAVHAHWSISNAIATIVMPTGTGKTDTMISILVSARCSKVLIIVPTDALRSQLAEKFLTLGILKKPNYGVLRDNAKFPIVCSLEHIPRSVDEVDLLFGNSQVIVTTSTIAGQVSATIKDRMAQHCPYLFIDEAHHAEAPTWSSFKRTFAGRNILQFTATPFREDGKPLDGEIIYKYPLKKAQDEGYFKPIEFRPVVQFNPRRSDRAIAVAAIEQLRHDADKGHIVMARVDNVARAKQVFELYRPYAEFNPVQLHTGIKSKRQRDDIRKKIISGEARIVVCVDMLGEGFDLPELKIAAFHDIRKTLPVTLQLAGRFTRARPDLGNATFIANTADVNVQDELRKLYTRDPDWNVLLPQLSDAMIGEQVSLQDFLHGFTDFTKEIPLKTVRPAISTVVYTTACAAWRPENYRAGIPNLSTCEQVHETINHAKNTLIVVTARRVPLAWTDVESLYSWEWELYVVFWSPDQNLLFINSSTNAGEYKALAEAVAGENVTLIRGQNVFRTFSGVTRLRLQNVGLTEQLGRNVRYTGRMGADVEAGLPDVQRRHALKSVLAGSGYEEGEETTIGASRKGRIWSHKRERVDQLVEWCKKIGAKLLDNTIDPEDILRGTLEAKAVLERPVKMPIAIDWPESVYTTQEAIWSVKFGDNTYSLSDLDLEIISPSVDGPLRFSISSETEEIRLELQLFEEEESPKYRFVVVDHGRASISRGERALRESIAEFFYNDPPTIWFADGSSLEGNQYIELRTTRPPYDVAKIQAWDWSGINIRKESQGDRKDADSIQARVIQTLRTLNYDMIIDDDGKGEAADVVTIRRINDERPRIEVEFYHCKYSQEATVGQRIKDLYEVCGQAQKSIFWMRPEKRTDLLTHLLRREERRQEAGLSSRYEVGDGELLLTIREMSRIYPMSLKIFIVQPGLSKSRATREQLELMSVSETYLIETFQLAFGVIASP